MEPDRILTGGSVALLAELPEACVDLAFADPPFNVGLRVRSP